MAKAQSLAMAFGGMSAGIGAWYMAAPRHFLSVIGAPATRRRIITTRLVAAQELAVGGALLADGRAARWLASRVAGDAMHAVMLALAWRAPDSDRQQMRLAWAALIAITVGDIAALLAARQMERTGLDEDEATGSSADAASVADGAIHRAVTINRPADEVYSFWRELDNLPGFMKHLERVDVIDDRRSHWVARAPFGGHAEWDAVITDDQPGERISWASAPGSPVWNRGEVTFSRAPADRGTEVHVRLEYAPPGGAVGRLVARVAGEEPASQIAGDLRRLKQVLETGEVVLSEPVADGRSRRQRPAQSTAA